MGPPPGADYWFSAHTLAGFALAGGGTNFSVVKMKWRNGFAVGATFEGEFSNVTRRYAGKGVVRYAW